MKQKKNKKLKQYEQHLTTALYCDYARNITTIGLQTLNEVYKELFNKESELGSGCGRCTLKSLKELAKEYFNYKEIIEERMEKAREGKNKEDNKTTVEQDNENGEEGEG